jgi:hypothetical protein
MAGADLYYVEASVPDRLWGDIPGEVVRLAVYLREHDPLADEDREWKRLQEITEKPWKWEAEYEEMLRAPELP